MSLTLEDLERDLAVMNMRKIQGLEDVHQLIGAINILEQQIHKVKNSKPVESKIEGNQEENEDLKCQML